MHAEGKAVCVSVCAAGASFYSAWGPMLQLVAVVIAIASGLFAIAVSWKKLRAP